MFGALKFGARQSNEVYMAGTILTVNAIWNKFSVPDTVGAEVVAEKKVGGVLLSSVAIEGRRVKDGTVEIFGILARGVQSTISPAIFLVNEFDYGIDESLIIDLVKRGFTVLAIDLAGKREDAERYTVYPESLSHAEYSNAKDDLFKIKGDVIGTCWYEWTAAAKYALKYLKSLPFVTKVGGFGIGKAATAVWQIIGTEESLDCAVFVRNAGWAGYRGIEKFGGMVEPQFSDNLYKYIAGVEPQTYAMHAKCPALVLCATNDNENDVDRAYDTVSKIKEDIYTAVNYSVGYKDCISVDAYKNAILFFNRFLLEGNTEKLPKDTEIKLDIVDGKADIEVIPYAENLKSVAVYVAQEITKSSLRSWQKITDYEKDGESYKFTFNPFGQSGIVMAFAVSTYKNGFSIGTNVVAKRFNETEVISQRKNNILYSSRIKNSESVFTAANPLELSPKNVCINDKEIVKVKKGPMGMEGLTCCRGLLTFKVGTECCKPIDGSMLMLDVYSKERATLEVKLISDYFGNKIEYLTRVDILGGDVWHNVQMEINRFKTAEGMPLKSYKKITAAEINVIGSDYLINNALWV